MPAHLAAGIDLGGTNLKVTLVDRAGRIAVKQSQPSDTGRGPDAVVEDMVLLVDRLTAEASVRRCDLIGVGVGSPGPLSVNTGRIHHCANLPGWRDVPLRDMLAERLKLPVVLDNDGNAAAFGEFCFGTGRGCRDMVVLTLGTGVGAGIVLDGRLVHGHFENAAELGHMIVQTGGLACPCGQRGCLEQYSSAAAVGRRAAAAVRAGEASMLSSAVQRGEAIDSVSVENAAKAGDVLCRRIWDEACLYLAIATINIQHALNPARVVLGGGMSSAGSFLLGRVQQYVAAHRWKLHDDVPELRLSSLGADAGVIGAAALVLHAPAALAPG